MKPLIKLRKKWLLPIKWGFRKNQKAKRIILPSNRELLDRGEELLEELSTHERNEHKEQIQYTKGQLNIINWLINDGTEG